MVVWMEVKNINLNWCFYDFLQTHRLSKLNKHVIWNRQTANIEIFTALQLYYSEPNMVKHIPMHLPLALDIKKWDKLYLMPRDSGFTLPQCLNDIAIRNKSTKGNWTKDFYSWSASRETKVKLIRGRYSILPKCMSIKAVSNGQFLIIVPSPIFNRVGQRIQIYRITKRHFRIGLDLVFRRDSYKTNERYKHNLLETNRRDKFYTDILCLLILSLFWFSLSSHILYCFVRIQ